MPNNTEATAMESQCQRVSVKTPEFHEANAKSWFVMMESQFILSQITNDQTKFHHAVTGLPASVVSQLPQDIIASMKYENLKKEVLAYYEKTRPELLDKLMAETSISGKPSAYLRELGRLAQDIGAGEDIVRHKFLQALPPSIAPVVASQKKTPLSELGTLADELLPLLNKTPRINAAPATYTPDQGIPPPRHRIPDPGVPQTGIPMGLRPYRRNQRPTICRAHLYFNNSARNCKPWCKWPNKKRGLEILPNSRSSSPVPGASSEN